MSDVFTFTVVCKLNVSRRWKSFEIFLTPWLKTNENCQLNPMISPQRMQEKYVVAFVHHVNMSWSLSINWTNDTLFRDNNGKREEKGDFLFDARYDFGLWRFDVVYDNSEQEAITHKMLVVGIVGKNMKPSRQNKKLLHLIKCKTNVHLFQSLTFVYNAKTKSRDSWCVIIQENTCRFSIFYHPQPQRRQRQKMWDMWMEW